MVATAARIGFVMEEWRRVVATTGRAQENYGALARESEDPVETFFDNTGDAQKVANARQALLSGDRRRFSVGVRDAEAIMALETTGAIPVARYVDEERGVDRAMLVSEI